MLHHPAGLACETPLHLTVLQALFLRAFVCLVPWHVCSGGHHKPVTCTGDESNRSSGSAGLPCAAFCVIGGVPAAQPGTKHIELAISVSHFFTWHGNGCEELGLLALAYRTMLPWSNWGLAVWERVCQSCAFVCGSWSVSHCSQLSPCDPAGNGPGQVPAPSIVKTKSP